MNLTEWSGSQQTQLQIKQRFIYAKYTTEAKDSISTFVVAYDRLMSENEQVISNLNL